MGEKLMVLWRKAFIWYLAIGAVFFFAVDHRQVAVKLLNCHFWVPQAIWKEVSLRHVPDRCLVRRGIRHYRNFAFILPANAEAYSALGFLEYHRGRWAAARQAYQKALARNDALPGLRYDLAVVYWREGKKDKALEMFKQELQSVAHWAPGGPVAMPDVCPEGVDLGHCMMMATLQKVQALSGGDIAVMSEGKQPLFYHVPMRMAVQDGKKTVTF
jgi:tetratricopeptide (TPR) repeat protein